MRSCRWFGALLAIAAAMGSAEARLRDDGPQSPRHEAAMLAGYKALYTCSGLFSAGLTPEMVTRDAMLGRGSRTDLLLKLTTRVDEQRKLVTVEYLPDMPPRVAAWRPYLGCAQLPIGAPLEAIDGLPRLPEDFSAPNFDSQDWPQGDRNATVRLPRRQAAALDKVVEAAFVNEVYGGVTWGVIVVSGGKIVAERYERGYDMHKLQRTHSAAKSVAATLIGIAVRDKLLRLDEPAPIPEWRKPYDPRARITLNNLLQMSSGLYTEAAGNPQQEIYLSGAAVAERSAGNLIDALPGTRMVYAGSDTLLAIRALRTVLNDDARYLQFPFRELFWKIGMTRTFPETDWNGDYLLSGQMYSTARDLARFGLLYLNDGVWNGERILPEGWTKYVATPAPAQPAGSWADPRCEGACDKLGYGAQFWLAGPKQGLPEGSYSVRGGRGQFVMIVPSRNVVIVRRGTDGADGARTSFDMQKFSADVLAALERR
jgi:CubicO group peptidase (beta-lactamase class C family)